jgi:hypothetical protein
LFEVDELSVCDLCNRESQVLSNPKSRASLSARKQRGGDGQPDRFAVFRVDRELVLGVWTGRIGRLLALEDRRWWPREAINALQEVKFPSLFRRRRSLPSSPYRAMLEPQRATKRARLDQ